MNSVMHRVFAVLVSLAALACQVGGGVDHCGTTMAAADTDGCCPTSDHEEPHSDLPCSTSHLASCCHPIAAVVAGPAPIVLAMPVLAPVGVLAASAEPTDPVADFFRPPIA